MNIKGPSQGNNFSEYNKIDHHDSIFRTKKNASDSSNILLVHSWKQSHTSALIYLLKMFLSS